jgi:predicted amidohydrolase
MARTVKVAAAQYPVQEITSFASFEAKLSRWVSQAAAEGAKILVFPEYTALELARTAGAEISRDLHGSIRALQSHLEDYDAAFASLSKNHGVHILAGSAPVRSADGGFLNQARLFAPGGASGYQDKHIMTRFEAEEWGISPGTGLCVFDIGIAKLGIAICYDAEFPLIARALAEGGAEILLVPSCTDTLAGYHRVRSACAARALENQFFAIQSSTVGDAPWSAALDINIGAAAVFAPPDKAVSDNGILAEGPLNAPRWVYADLDLDALARVREDGEVLNSKRWSLQPGSVALPHPQIVRLE